MKALTISQPFATLIASGEKWCENRTWECFYRGPLLIHAGKGTQYMTAKEMREKSYPASKIVAACRMIECVHVGSLEDRIRRGMPYRNMALVRMQELKAHEHCEGPYGFVLAEVQALPEPVECKGAQGLWVPSAEVIEAVKAQLQWQLT